MQGWQESCQDLKNSKLKAWVMDAASTCAKLPSLQVELVRVAKTDEAKHSWLRETKLSLNDNLWMLAYAELKSDSATILADFVSNKPLGSWLFAANSDWRRSSFLYKIDKIDSISTDVLLAAAIVARRSEFLHKSNAKIILTEVFLEHPFWEDK